MILGKQRVLKWRKGWLFCLLSFLTVTSGCAVAPPKDRYFARLCAEVVSDCTSCPIKYSSLEVYNYEDHYCEYSQNNAHIEDQIRKQEGRLTRCEVDQLLYRGASDGYRTLQGFIEITYTRPWGEEYKKRYLCSYNDEENGTVTSYRFREHQPENSGQE